MTKPPALEPGQEVEWNWGQGKGHGKIAKVIRTDTTATIKGAKITRKASAARPAVEVKTDKGGKVLKSVSEIRKK